MIRSLLHRLRRFRSDESGASTVEFVIIFPAFLAVFLAAVESGFMMARYVMLDRAVDLVVRDLRIGGEATPDFDEFKARVCENTVILADCLQVVQVQLEPVDQTTWATMEGPVRCIDQDATIDPVTETRYALGDENEFMLVRVCALYRPFFPVAIYSMRMPSDGNGNYALVTTSAFVNEPS